MKSNIPNKLSTYNPFFFFKHRTNPKTLRDKQKKAQKCLDDSPMADVLESVIEIQNTEYKPTETQPKLCSLVYLSQFSLWRNFYQLTLRLVSKTHTVFPLCVYFHLDTLCIIDSHTIYTLERAYGQVSEEESTSIGSCMCVRSLNAHLLGCVHVCVLPEPQMDDTHNSLTHTHTRLSGSKSVETTQSCYQKVFLSKCPWVAAWSHHRSTWEAVSDGCQVISSSFS